MSETYEDTVDAVVKQANALLVWLKENVKNDWRAVIQEVVSPNDIEAFIKTVLRANKGIEPIGAIAGSTSQIRNLAGLGGEDLIRAIRLLKSTGKIMQSGKGRGNAVVLLSAEEVSATLRETIPPEKDEIDLESLLERTLSLARAQKASYILEIKKLDAEVTVLSGRVKELEDQKRFTWQ